MAASTFLSFDRKYPFKPLVALRMGKGSPIYGVSPHLQVEIDMQN